MNDVTAGNLADAIAPNLAQLPEQVSVLLANKAVRIERIVSQGHCSAEGFWYDQVEHEFVLLVSGGAELRIEGEPARTLKAGDWMVLPAHVRHRVEWTDPNQPTVWLAVFWS